jgi:hypothetical protein
MIGEMMEKVRIKRVKTLNMCLDNVKITYYPNGAVMITNGEGEIMEIKTKCNNCGKHWIPNKDVKNYCSSCGESNLGEYVRVDDVINFGEGRNDMGFGFTLLIEQLSQSNPNSKTMDLGNDTLKCINCNKTSSECQCKRPKQFR